MHQKIRKKNKNKNKICNDYITSSSVPQAPDWGGDKDEFIRQLQSIATSRFCHQNFFTMNLSTVKSVHTVRASKVKTPSSPTSTAGMNSRGSSPPTVPTAGLLLSSRISRVTLLRRICHVTGLRVIARDYDFDTLNPFEIEDIVTFIPLVKTSEQHIPLPEISEMLNTARNLLQRGDLSRAFEYAQEASQLLHLIVGPTHKETAQSLNLVTNIMTEGGDNETAADLALRNLSISVQIDGLDNQSTAHLHSQVAALLSDLGYHIPAIKHLLTAKYLVTLLGGDRHPELVEIYLRLVGVYTHEGEYDVAQRLLVEAKNLSQDVNKQALIGASIAEVHDKMGNLEAAVVEQRAVYKVMETLYGPEDDRALQAKRNIKKYLRNLTISKVNAARASQESIDKRNGQESIEKRNGQEKVDYKDNTYIYDRDNTKMDEKGVLEASNTELLGAEEDIKGVEKIEKKEKFE